MPGMEEGDILEGTNNGFGDYWQQKHEPETGGFIQNRSQDWMESVIYVNILELDGQELILMVTTQLTPVNATVNASESSLYGLRAL